MSCYRVARGSVLGHLYRVIVIGPVAAAGLALAVVALILPKAPIDALMDGVVS